jgi:Holliday junction resolvase RusA-like endonuclease
MIKMMIKPMSVNKAWQGKRYKTPAYKQYEKAINYLLPASLPNLSAKEISQCKRLKVVIEYGFSSPLADIDNPTKLIIDIMQKKYGFNDRRIYEMHLFKKDVKKGQEYIKFEINRIEQ